MCLVVTGIGTLIHLYSTAYMAEEESSPRFFAYLNLFMFSMLLLVLGGNLLVLFVGWEGVGLCSYLLIGFWYKNLAYAAAGRKAFVVNRIGDAGFLLGIFLLYTRYGTIDFMLLSNALAVPDQKGFVDFCTLVAFCLFVGATGKSAQIPLFVWLPDAMAGPTPVSALIHAATMVTAGVYMLARMNFLFEAAPYVGFIICLVAVTTAFVSATIAMTQNDIKKVLAYSTVSQLGFMFMAASVGAYWAALFHVVTHAFFKACLFLCAGSVIHGCHHEQDMRHMGGLMKLMPITALTYGVSTLAIAGIAPFAGFYSKHAILAALEGTHNEYLMSYAPLLAGMATLTAFLTAFYMTRSFAMTFLGSYHGHAHPHESPIAMTLPLMILAILACVGGIYLEPRLPHYLEHVMHVHAHHSEGGILGDILASYVGVLGVAIGLLLYTGFKQVPGQIYRALRPLGDLSAGKWYFDELYALIIVRPLEQLAQILWRTVDQGLIDGTVNGTAAVIDMQGEALRVTQTGQIRHYAFFMFLGTLFIILVYLVL
jgi:NADH-quinone oxidoreductase subunit L